MRKIFGRARVVHKEEPGSKSCVFVVAKVLAAARLVGKRRMRRISVKLQNLP